MFVPDFSFHIDIPLYEKILLAKKRLGRDVPGDAIPYIESLRKRHPLLAQILHSSYMKSKSGR
jgi:hypothetical protein